MAIGDEYFAAQPEDLSLADRQRMEQPGWPKMAFVRRRFNADFANWWVPNPACIEAMLGDVGFEIFAKPGDEMYVCRLNPQLQKASLREPGELGAAVGPRHAKISQRRQDDRRLNDGGDLL